MHKNISDDNESNQALVEKVCENLDASLQRMDAETQHKLIAAREKALTQRASLFTFNWPKAALAAACSVALAILVITTQFSTQSLLQGEGVEVLELTAAQDTLELYEELEFYTWLAEEDAAS